MESNEPEGSIHLDVMVTDPTGKPVSGLKAADFAVLDKGQPEEIVSFHAYDRVSARPDPPTKIILVLDMLEAPELASSQGERSGCSLCGGWSRSHFEAHKHTPDLIVLDLELPAGDGFIVLDRLKTNP
jgi:PleD family two-component response regulator